MTVIPVPNNQVSRQALNALLEKRQLLAALGVFHEALGDIFRIPVPGFNPVMLAGPEANRFVLVEQRDQLRWRSEQDPVTRLLRHGVLVEDGETHDSLRREMNPALHRRAIEGYIETMWQATDQIIDGWADRSEPVDMLVEMRRVALLILMKTLFSVDFEPDMERLWKPILKALSYISPGPWVVWRAVPRPGYRPALRQLDDYMQRLITLRRAAPGDDLLGMLIASSMSDALIRDQLLTLIIAGHDTSTALLSWALYSLAIHPAIQARAREEVDRVLGGRTPDLASVSELRYLDQVIDETLRLYPPIHLGSRVAARDLEFQSYPIPAGTRVLYSIFLSHRDKRYWQAPDTFDPDRFAPEQARQRPPYTFVPFGGGPRNCIGTAFAQVEAKIVLARCLQKYTFAFVGRPARLHMGATLEPRPGVQVIVRRRD